MTSTLTDTQRAISARIVMKLINLGIQAHFIEPVIEGPVVSVFRFKPQGATRVSQIEALSSDFAVGLGVEDVLVKRMPGEESVGIFVPNAERRWIKWRDIVGELTVNKSNSYIPLLLGVDNLGHTVVEDLTLYPHLLIAGSTGSGKSTLLNSILASLVYSCSSNEVQLVLSDTKGVEFGHFIGAPHLLYDPAVSVYQTLEQMDWLIEELEKRLKIFSKRGHRNILEYNQNCTNTQDRLAYIVLVIDELADLLGDNRRADKERGPSVGRIASSKLSVLAEKARASGIHIIASTQRPSVKLVSGDIKANFPARLCFRLPTEADSRTVLGTGGAEHLLSRGDMMFVSPNAPLIRRIHAPLASIEDIKAAIEVSVRKG